MQALVYSVAMKPVCTSQIAPDENIHNKIQEIPGQ